MLNEYFSFIGNYICRESIRNISKQLDANELKSFSNHDYYYLTTIHYMEEPTLSRIAEELSLTKPAVTVFIKKLIKMSLVEKIQSEKDKRVYHIRLTNRGRNVVMGDELAYEKISSLLDSLIQNEDQKKWVYDLLKNIVVQLKEKDD